MLGIEPRSSRIRNDFSAESATILKNISIESYICPLLLSQKNCEAINVLSFNVEQVVLPGLKFSSGMQSPCKGFQDNISHCQRDTMAKLFSIFGRFKQ